MGARRVADTSPAHVDWFDYLARENGTFATGC